MNDNDTVDLETIVLDSDLDQAALVNRRLNAIDEFCDSIEAAHLTAPTAVPLSGLELDDLLYRDAMVIACIGGREKAREFIVDDGQQEVVIEMLNPVFWDRLYRPSVWTKASRRACDMLVAEAEHVAAYTTRGVVSFCLLALEDCARDTDAALALDPKYTLAGLLLATRKAGVMPTYGMAKLAAALGVDEGDEIHG